MPYIIIADGEPVRSVLPHIFMTMVFTDWGYDTESFPTIEKAQEKIDNTVFYDENCIPVLRNISFDIREITVDGAFA